MKKTRILFVCLGNICRSPMAEMIFAALCEKAGCRERFEIASAATSTEEIGNPVYPPARAELTRRGVPLLPHRARQMQKSDYARYDLLIGMEESNLLRMRRISGGDPEGKIRKLMDFTPGGGDVADPWYSGRFDIAYEDIAAGCAGLLEALKQD